ncbi:MAG: prolyl oligopeptidase family serine peptidase, partial [Chloroflexota bacterium]
MSEPQVAPYGSWTSPITAQMVASASIRLGQIAFDGDDLYWVEMRPSEGGRHVVVRRTPDRQAHYVTPPPFNARTRAHEYGGGGFAVADGVVSFANFPDQRLYRLDARRPGATPQPITPQARLRYADGVVDLRRNRLICVREDHTAAGQQATNTLVEVALDGSAPEDGGQVLVSGNDFYASPRLSPDGSRLVWLTWNHPNMPWDGTELWVGELAADGSLGRTQRVAGGLDESIYQPEWSPDGVLHFVSDRTGWWNLYRWRPAARDRQPTATRSGSAGGTPADSGQGRIEPLTTMEAEFGRPQWVFGTATYGFESAGRIICAYTTDGRWRLASLDTATGRLDPMPIPYTEIRDLRVAPGRVALHAGSATEPLSLVLLDLATGQSEIVRRTSDVAVDAGYLSTSRAIEFPTEHGLTAHAFFYPPQHRDYRAPESERPPLLVKSHGGPTSATSSALSLSVQYWTSRGIAVLDVDYGGSTGYGRAYRERLNGQWGVVDVDDCVNGARYLVQRGEVDGERLAISGGSAGGYTTLCALTFRDTFKAGASYYGI